MYYYLYIENDVVLSKKIRSREVAFDNEFSITEDVYNNISIPSKISNDEYIPCDWPTPAQEDLNEEVAQ